MLFAKEHCHNIKKTIKPPGNRVILNDQQQKYVEDASIFNEEKAIKIKFTLTQEKG